MKLKLTKWLIVAATGLGFYYSAENTGLAFGGQKQTQPIDSKDLRSGAPGSWNYVYLYHGNRGK